MEDQAKHIAEGTNIYVAATRSPDVRDTEWLPLLESADVRGLIVALGMMAATGGTGERLTARRESVSAILHVKLTEQEISTMERLDAAATRLSRMSLYLTGAAAFVGLVSLVGLFG